MTEGFPIYFAFCIKNSMFLCFEWLYNRKLFIFRPPYRPLQPRRNHRQMTKNSTQNLFSCAEVRKDIAVNFLGCDAILCLRSMLFVPKDDMNC